MPKILIDIEAFMDSINYMAKAWTTFKEHQFLGFLPTKNLCWGACITPHTSDEREGYVACHVFFQDTPRGDPPAGDRIDTIESAKENPYVLMFYGVDNESYFWRFKTKKDALEAFNNLNCIDALDQRNIYYNS